MDIKIIEKQNEALNITIRCKKVDDEVTRLKSHIELFGQKLKAKKDGGDYFVAAADALYFESVDDHTFLYTRDDVMEIKQRLYELECILPSKDFIRISKSLIVNIGKIRSLKPELNRTVSATMCNGECLCISRKYVPAVKKMLSI